MSAYLFPLLPFAFSLFVACASVFLISGAYLLFFKIDRVNAVMKHPYLAHQPFRRYPKALQFGMLLDYFFRLSFPHTQFSLIGHANRQLAHIDPKTVPTDVKWPLIGMWGGCWVGLVAMACVWVLLFMGAGAR
ncbi:hypothetical protein [Orrella dioscoreae]|uniref:Putative membrane protein n=1 Tax=Orrella dioscoreae TaxID=1851544 RepID=A0A1C3K063_9BURK|nr:putative membrane protein [Orrella dioscoreae]SOE50681.1 putative membrane protein [Orrella dioscoreae]